MASSHAAKNTWPAICSGTFSFRAESWPRTSSTEAAAADAVGRLRDHWARWVHVIGVPSPGDGGFHYSDVEEGSGTVVRAGRFVAGLRCDLEGPSLEAQQGLLEELTNRLAPARADAPH